MPKTSRSGQPKQTELPSTLQRSPRKAQATFSKAYDAALEQYHDEERAHRVAYSALKHTHEKWVTTGKSRNTRAPRTRRPKAGGTPTDRRLAVTTRTPRKTTCKMSRDAST
jgi:cation transport regulator ChaB